MDTLTTPASAKIVDPVIASKVLAPTQTFHNFDSLWLRLQELSLLIAQVDCDILDNEDRQELDSVERITAGYAYFVLEGNVELKKSSPISVDISKNFTLLINAHCDDSLSAVRFLIARQRGEDHKKIRFV